MSNREATKLVIELLGLAALIVYTIFSVLQWSQIRWTNRLTREALNGSDRSLNETLGKLQKQIEAANKVAVETAKLSRAAETSARTAQDALHAQEHAFVVQERPFLIVKDIQPFPMKEGQPLYVNFTSPNYGRTPALHLRSVSNVFYGKDPLKQADLWFAALPRVPTSVIKKGPEFIEEPAAANSAEKPMFSTVTSPRMLSRDDITDILANDLSVAIVGRFYYEDLAGHQYSTDYCFSHFKTGATPLCGRHNVIR